MAELESQGKEKLQAQGVEEGDVEVRRSADMRYLDQVYEVNIPVPDPAQEDSSLLEELEANFHRRYQELFSYRQQDQEVRLVTLRVTVVGRLPRVAPPEVEAPQSVAGATKMRRVYLGEWREVPVYAIDELTPAVEVSGPALLESDFTTILVEPGDNARLSLLGGIELQVAQVSPDTFLDVERPVDRPDPVTLAVIEHRLESIALEMTEVMLRTSMSQILNSSRDFSTAILDADCQLVAQGEGIPVHISALPIAGARCEGLLQRGNLGRGPVHSERSLLRR